MHPSAHKGNKGGFPFQYLCADLATVIRRSAFWRDKREIGVEPRSFRLRPLYWGTGAFCLWKKVLKEFFLERECDDLSMFSFPRFLPVFYTIPFPFLFRSCRGGTSFLCRQRKDAKRAQRGESCFPPLNPLQSRGGGSTKLAQKVCRLTERRPPAQIAGIPRGHRSLIFFI